MDRMLALVAIVVGLGLVATPWAVHLSAHGAAVVAAVVAGGALVAALGVALIVQDRRHTPRHR